MWIRAPRKHDGPSAGKVRRLFRLVDRCKEVEAASILTLVSLFLAVILVLWLFGPSNGLWRSYSIGGAVWVLSYLLFWGNRHLEQSGWWKRRFQAISQWPNYLRPVGLSVQALVLGLAWLLGLVAHLAPIVSLLEPISTSYQAAAYLWLAMFLVQFLAWACWMIAMTLGRAYLHKAHYWIQLDFDAASTN